MGDDFGIDGLSGLELDKKIVLMVLEYSYHMNGRCNIICFNEPKMRIYEVHTDDGELHLGLYADAKGVIRPPIEKMATEQDKQSLYNSFVTFVKNGYNKGSEKKSDKTNDKISTNNKKYEKTDPEVYGLSSSSKKKKANKPDITKRKNEIMNSFKKRTVH